MSTSSIPKDDQGEGIRHMTIEDGVITSLIETPVGYLITDDVLTDDVLDGEWQGRWIVGFCYSADLAAQRYFELTGVSLEIAEMKGAS